ncbi:MAG: hypothetical protein HYX76_10890, partial [Acidobacteria bacterium]|nr:hypothetical protein [Acidobacteriota bacterium]
MASHVCRAISRVTSYWLVLVTMALCLAATARSAGAQVCFPTCSQIDGRFLVVPGGPPSAGDTFANFDIVIGLHAPSSSTLPQVDIFDGDTGGGVNGGHWDQGTTPMDYSIYLDLDGDGQIDAGDTLLVSESGAIMPDNSWFSLTIPAGSPTAANYFLVVHNPDPDTFAWNAFKMRTTGTFEIAPQTFAFLAPLGNINDAQTIYPNYPGLGNTSYVGSWTFAFSVPSPQQSITLFDGDMDFGSWNCTTRDTDDPDTD